MSKPLPASYPHYFQKYIDLVPDEDLLTGFVNQSQIITHLLAGITEEKSHYKYAPGKWTLKDMLQHIIDTERIFCYRALCFARKEAFHLPGFAEAEYAANAVASKRTWQSMAEEFIAVRHAAELLFKSFSDEELLREGIANNISTSVASMGFITLGHLYHHKKIIEELYI
jgi:DinB superfamily